MTITTRVVPDAPEGHATPLLAVLVPEGGLPESLVALDRQVDGVLRRLFQSRDFKGEVKESVVLYPHGPASRLQVIGLGKASEITRDGIRRGAAIAGKTAQGLGADQMSLFLAPEISTVDTVEASQAMAEGVHAGSWRFAAMKKPPEDPKPDLATVSLLFPEGKDEAEKGRNRGAAIGAGHVFARGLQVLPGNVCTPTHLATTAKDLAKRHGFEVTILDGDGIREEGMGALLAVAQGSTQDPRFIILEYHGAGDQSAPIVLVGKGITFDTGGISIKPAPNMEDMKFDMSGAAAVLGTFETLGRLKPKVNVVGLVPSAENMPSSTAYKPGDVVKSHLGKTIEVVNTDAEGRLVLADALSYAHRFKPACVIDAATLTGAVVIGLGNHAIGLMSNDADLVKEVLGAGERAGERAWELPCWEEYHEQIKSDIADMKNVGGRTAGTITAGWFLREFVEGYAWAHLDIAGTAYTDRETGWLVKGPTGIGVRLFSEFILGRE
jgi:leucyl aminopeptidase